MNAIHPIRLALLTGCPVPVKVPLYRQLAQDPRVDFTAIFASSEGVRPFDNGYGRLVTWDADLTSGYRAVFLRSADRTPGLGEHIWSVRNWDVVSVLARGRFDALWLGGYNSITYLLAAAAQIAAGRRVLFREEQTTLERRSLSTTIAKEVALRLLFKQGYALYIGSENRRWFEHYGVPNDRLFFAPYTVDNQEYQSCAAKLSPDRDEIRHAFGIPPDSGPVIATVSRLTPAKQPTFLLEAFRRARERCRCVLLVVGSGEAESELRNQVRHHGIPDVVFAGFLARGAVPKAYVAADVFALLSRESETFGLVVPEAMNFGLPVVVSDRVGCAADLVSSDYNGFVVSSRDPAQAAAALTRLVSDSELRAAMGSASRARIDGWNQQRTANGIIKAATVAIRRDPGGSRTRFARFAS